MIKAHILLFMGLKYSKFDGEDDGSDDKENKDEDYEFKSEKRNIIKLKYRSKKKIFKSEISFLV